MKKLLLLSAIMTIATSAWAGPMSGIPYADHVQALATADYGGVLSSTAAFSASYTTATLTGSGVVYGVIFTTGDANSFDFVDVFEGTAALTSTRLARFYNVQNTTSATSGVAAGFSGSRWPLRFGRGLSFKANVATYNIINLLYWKNQ